MVKRVFLHLYYSNTCNIGRLIRFHMKINVQANYMYI